MNNTTHGGQPALNVAEQQALQALLSDHLWEDALEILVRHADYATLAYWLLERISDAISGDDEVKNCLHIMRHWLADRTDDDARRQIFTLSELQGFDTPLGALGLSLFWSQGSMTPEDAEPVFPEPQLSPLMLLCSLKLLCLAEAKENPPVDGAICLLRPWLKGEIR